MAAVVPVLNMQAYMYESVLSGIHLLHERFFFKNIPMTFARPFFIL